MRLLCAQYIPAADYTSDETVASDIKDFIKQVGGDVIESNEWRTVFADPDPTIHFLYSDGFMWAFIVYKEVDGSESNGIFDIGNGCWLDLND